MRHGHQIEGKAFRLRPIEDRDAEFVVELRTSGERARYLNKVALSAETQRKWLEAYYQRENDYYFVIERINDNRREGLIALYDVNPEGGEAEWGRWIISPASMSALESVIMIMDFAFVRLGLKRVFSFTLADNTPVNSFHESCGFRRVMVQPARFIIGGEPRDAVKHECEVSDWSTLRQGLSAHSERIARRIQSHAAGR